MPTLETNQLLSTAVDAADSRKAEEIRILALDPSESALTDYFLICNGTNERQNAAIADEIEGRLKREYGIYPNSVEGRRQGEWILMDYVDFVVHIFMPEKREYYGLERLRKTATRVSIDDLNADITKALADARKKKPVAAAPAEDADSEDSTTKRGGKTGRKTSARVSKALAGTVEIADEEEKPKKAKAGVKKAAAKKAAAKKTPAKRSVTPQPAGKKGARKAPSAKK
ncbi:ribosome silencing factor [Terriglobus aquaticus]|uniref:Ribosomal silencing factor RsfS n=1 Tax=Terriglobus aquaticus TaxID=940139 RepID=A0ABW9KNY0_9BACT|nr:ribosome silencing factor [Terriglobus aquaticus]